MNYGAGRCICEPSNRFLPFPTMKQNPDGRQQWTKNVNRLDKKKWGDIDIRNLMAEYALR